MNYLPTLYVGFPDFAGSFGTTGPYRQSGVICHAAESAIGNATQNAARKVGAAFNGGRADQTSEQNNGLALLL